MRVLVAGGSGFIGKNFLLKTPKAWQCFGTYNTSSDFPEFLKNNNLEHVEPIKVEMRDSESVQKAYDKQNEFDVCLYVMGNSNIGLSRKKPLTDLSYNVHSLLNLIQSINVGKFIFMSSGSVYEGYQGLVNPGLPVKPTLPYSVAKLASERYIEYFQKHTDHIDNFVILRFFGAYGPMEPSRKLYTNLIKSFCIKDKNEFSIFGNGKNFIDAMYIQDAVEALLKIAISDKGNKIVDFCMGSPLTINELIHQVANIFGKKDMVLTHKGEAAEYTTFYASPREMEALFGFLPETSLNDGMKKFRNYLMNNRKQAKD